MGQFRVKATLTHDNEHPLTHVVPDLPDSIIIKLVNFSMLTITIILEHIF